MNARSSRKERLDPDKIGKDTNLWVFDFKFKDPRRHQGRCTGAWAEGVLVPVVSGH